MEETRASWGETTDHGEEVRPQHTEPETNTQCVRWRVNGRDVEARLCVEDRRLSLEIDQYYVLCIDEDGTFWRDRSIGESSGLKLDDFGRIVEQDPLD